MAKIAGMESRAKTTSVNSIRINTRNRGVIKTLFSDKKSIADIVIGDFKTAPHKLHDTVILDIRLLPYRQQHFYPGK